MPSLEFSVYCGICGNGVCNDSDVDGKNNVTVTCHYCQDNISRLDDKINELEEQNAELTQELIDKGE
jgi:hypothetical protein